MANSHATNSQRWTAARWVLQAGSTASGDVPALVCVRQRHAAFRGNAGTACYHILEFIRNAYSKRIQ